MRGVQVLQAHGQSGQGGGVRQAVADVERFQRGAGQLVELRAVGEQVLAERLVEQRLDEVLLSCRSHDVRAIRTGAVAHAGVLRGLGAVEMLQAPLQVQTGIGVLGVERDTDVHASQRVDHAAQSLEVHHHDLLDVQAGQRVHRVHRATGRGRQVAPIGVGVGEDRVELHVILRGDGAVGRGAAGDVDHGIAGDRNQIDIGAVGGDLRHDRRVRIVEARGLLAAAAHGGVAVALAGVLTQEEHIDRLAGVHVHQLGLVVLVGIVRLHRQGERPLFDGAVDVHPHGRGCGADEGEGRQ